MRPVQSLFLLAFTAVSAASAATLYAVSYAGEIKTLSFTEYGDAFELKETSSTRDCAPQPSWLELDNENNMVYCITESNLIYALKNEAGKLSSVQSVQIIPGSVSSTFFNQGEKRALAIASYGGSGVTTLSAPPGGSLSPLEQLTFTMSAPGPKPDRQEAPHPHQAITDPTGKFVIVPDLGADLVRVWAYDAATNVFKQIDPLIAEPGTGPRHAAFWTPTENAHRGAAPPETYLHLIGELDSVLTSYRVVYAADLSSISFERVSKTGILGPDAVPAGSLAAEIQVSPDNGFVTVTSRFDALFTAPNPDPGNATAIASDAFGVFRPQPDGTLEYVGKFAAGGTQPRHFDISDDGRFVAVGLQASNVVRVYKRDVATGEIGPEVAAVQLQSPVMTVWG